MIKCPNCGKTFEEDLKICEYCGTTILSNISLEERHKIVENYMQKPKSAIYLTEPKGKIRSRFA